MALDWLRPPLPHSWPARPDKSIDAFDDDDHDEDGHDDECEIRHAVGGRIS